MLENNLAGESDVFKVHKSYLGKTHIKKVFILVVGPLMFYFLYPHGLVVHATFIARN